MLEGEYSLKWVQIFMGETGGKWLVGSFEVDQEVRMGIFQSSDLILESTRVVNFTT